MCLFVLEYWPLCGNTIHGDSDVGNGDDDDLLGGWAAAAAAGRLLSLISWAERLHGRVAEAFSFSWGRLQDAARRQRYSPRSLSLSSLRYNCHVTTASTALTASTSLLCILTCISNSICNKDQICACVASGPVLHNWLCKCIGAFILCNEISRGTLLIHNMLGLRLLHWKKSTIVIEMNCNIACSLWWWTLQFYLSLQPHVKMEWKKRCLWKTTTSSFCFVEGCRSLYPNNGQSCFYFSFKVETVMWWADWVIPVPCTK